MKRRSRSDPLPPSSLTDALEWSPIQSERIRPAGQIRNASDPYVVTISDDHLTHSGRRQRETLCAPVGAFGELTTSSKSASV